MKFTTIATTFALASQALAVPTFWKFPHFGGWNHKNNECVNDQSAHKIVERFIGIQNHEGSDLGSARQTAEKLLDENYQEISDSILSLQQRPLGGVTFSGRASYIEGVLHAPATTDIDTLGIYVSGCDKIIWQWRYNNVGTAQYPVKGFHLFTINGNGQIAKTELEFNSVAWGIDTFQLPCDNAPSAPSVDKAVSSVGLDH